MFRLLIMATLAWLAAACATTPENAARFESKTLAADGYGLFDDSGRISIRQRWLTTQQVAKLNAYRGIADQLYYEPVGNNKTVGSQVVSHEAYRVYLDGYLREAKTSDYRTVQNRLKTTMNLTLTPRFYQCMGGDMAQIRRCLREDDKLPITRLGTNAAIVTSANLACGNRDCSDQLYVKGFARDRNMVDDTLLDIGLYDTQWIVNTGANTFFNYFLMHGFLNAL